MSRVKIEDLPKNAVLSKEELKRILGGLSWPFDTSDRGRVRQFQNEINVVVWTGLDDN